MALFAAFDILFGIEVDSDIYSDVWVICLAVLWPWVALYAIPRNFDDPEGNFAPVWLRFVAGILLVPIASIYLVVLYAYGISILVSWDLPRGNVANIACGFAAVGVITHLISYPWRDSGSRWLRTFFRTFHVLLFVPIALLAIAVGKRVGDYGVTEERYFLAIAAAWLAVMALYFTLRGRRIVLVPASLATLLIAASFGTWGATATSERSQVGILHDLLSEAGLIENGQVTPSDGTVGFELRKRISSVLDYLATSGKVEAIRPLFANTDVDFAGDARLGAPDLVTALGFDYVGQWQDSATFSFNGPDRAQIEIAGFDMLVERSLWRGRDDETVVAEDGRAFTVLYDDALGVLTVAAEDGETVSFALAELAETLLGAGYTGATGVTSERMIRAMTLDAAEGPFRVRALVMRLWGDVDAATPSDVAAEVILLIGYPSGGE